MTIELDFNTDINNNDNKRGVRHTSIEVYNKIRNNGLLSKKRLEIYETIFNNGSMTSAEAFVIINKDKPNINVLTQSRARFTELRDLGVLKELGTRICKITKHNAIVWEVTNNLPINFKKLPTRKEKKDYLLNSISELIDKTDNNFKSELINIYNIAKEI